MDFGAVSDPARPGSSRSAPVWLQPAMTATLGPMRLDELDYAPAAGADCPAAAPEAGRFPPTDPRSPEPARSSDQLFAAFPDLLRGDELLVLNNARVIPARLFGHRAGVHSQAPSKTTKTEHLTGKVEVLLTKRSSRIRGKALVRPGRKLPVGERIRFGARRAGGGDH